MPDPTRRRALLAVASGVAALAGCAGSDDRPAIDHPGGDRPIEEYETRHVRNDEGAVLFARGEELPTVTGDERSRYVRSGRHVVVSEDTLAELVFGTVPEAERLRSFAAATDFDSSSLYLLAMPVDACYEIRLRSVSVEWETPEREDVHPHADFCRTYRPADVDCDADVSHTVGFAIRLPVAAQRSSGHGRGMSSSCGPSPRNAYFNATVTPASGGEGK